MPGVRNQAIPRTRFLFAALSSLNHLRPPHFASKVSYSASPQPSLFLISPEKSRPSSLEILIFAFQPLAYEPQRQPLAPVATQRGANHLA